MKTSTNFSRRIALAAAAFPLILSAAANNGAAQDTTLVLEGARVVVAPKASLDGSAARIAIRGGKVASVGEQIPAELLNRAERVQFDGATLVPGFVLTHDFLGAAQDVAETISAFTPSLVTADAFDPFDKALEKLARGGVTSVGLAPSSRNVVGGLAAAVRWSSDGIGDVFESTTYLKASLIAAAFDQNRFPTSRMGAADMMRVQFGLVKDPLRSGEPVLADVLSGSRKLAIHADTVAEITEALALCEEFGVQPILLSARDAAECIEEIARAKATLALAPLGFSTKPKQLKTPAMLAKAGVTFSFLGNTADALRRSAALAVRHGLDRDTAIAAMTRVPAQQLGIDDRVGTLRNGRHADIAVFDGDPLDLTSKLLAVFLAGSRVSDSEAPSK